MTSLWAFTATASMLLLAPGPAVAFVLTRSLQAGRTAGVISQLGLCTGLLVHVAGAALGLSAVIAGSAAAFTTLKLLGAGYLVWLGVRTLTSGRAMGLDPSAPPSAIPKWRRLFFDGFVIDALNPKPALFFLALLPQFVDPAAGAVWLQMAALGLFFVFLAFVTGSLYALLAGAIAPHLNRSRPLQRATRWASGSTYVALGVLAAAWKR